MTPSPLLQKFLTRPPEHLESEFYALDALDLNPFAQAAALRSEIWPNLNPVQQTAWALLYGRATSHNQETIDLLVHLREWFLALEAPDENELTLKRLWGETCRMEKHGSFLTVLFFPLRFKIAMPQDDPCRIDDPQLGHSLRITVAALIASIVGDTQIWADAEPHLRFSE